VKQVLSVASEIYPLIKTGGLADVAGALPLALASHGIATRSLIPGYPAVLSVVEGAVPIAHFDDLLGGPATVLEAHHAGIDLLILDAPAYYQRSGGPYLDQTGRDYADNWKRFAALSLAAARIANGAIGSWKPDILHAHDWQAALAPVYLKYLTEQPIPSVLTIHNIAFQGQFRPRILAELGLPELAFDVDTLEYYGDVSFLKGGLQTATAITTVSPSYAEEILTPYFGMGLEGVIANRNQALSGVVNGIDPDTWDPASDPHIAAPYTAAKLKNRLPNKRALERHFKINEDDSPLFCVISRLTWQKGIDLLINNIDEMVGMGAKLVVLGAGDVALEGALISAASRHPGRVGVSIGYDEGLSHLMQAGSDAIIVPSRFEPCGLTQLYALRYGCIPVVTRTGGLNDTVIDANHAALSAKVATGVQFAQITTEGLRSALKRTMRLYANNDVWQTMQKQGMKSDVSWNKSAGLYAALYREIHSKGH
jgi:starch synthase